ncbi:hypothetical protein CTA2_9556 [Colletotrichum tanaceti]|uniref:Uncharacterized protein n=1 Tax=Colletotrichum tanaceti TaxID=1306861 RepID=A0A4U6X530_9PEZI|nr:hypothetical protein CTA2_9556 [Colletotrichum tanaceti]TKW50520.1 hypothetical protein CTA1_1522 [Colletotrichum tanaceti]
MSAPSPAKGTPCMTARVIREWTQDDVDRLEKQGFISGHLHRGIQGYILQPDRLVQNQYYIFQPLIEDENGWHFLHPNEDYQNAVFVHKNYIELGEPQLPMPRIVGIDKPFNVAKARKNMESPLAQFITAFLETCVATGDSLQISGVSGEQIGLLKRENGILNMTNRIIEGMKTANTFDMFKNGLPSLKDLIMKGKKIHDFARADKQKLENMLTLYVIVYFFNDPTSPALVQALIYGGRTIRGWERFKEHDTNIRSATPVIGGTNHYETVKRIRREEVEKGNKCGHVYIPIALMKKPQLSDTARSFQAWAEQTIISLFRSYHPGILRMPDELHNYSHFWSSAVAQKLTEIVLKLTWSNDPQRPAEFPKFGPKATPGLMHGLNWSSPVMEMFHDEAGLWTRILVKDVHGTPLYWQFRGPPRRVRDDKYVNEADRKTIGLLSRRMPSGMGHSSDQQFFRISLRQDAGESWPVKPGEYVVPVVEIMCDPDAIHPHVYAAVPDVGGFDCWAQARRVAIRVEYLDERGDTYSRYCRPRRIFCFYKSLPASHGTPEQIHCLERGWSRIMSLMATFIWDWQNRPGGLPSDIIDSWKARVRAIEYDLFTQTFKVAVMKKEPMGRPKLLSFDDTLQRMRNLYGNIAIGYPKWTEGVVANRSQGIQGQLNDFDSWEQRDRTANAGNKGYGSLATASDAAAVAKAVADISDLTLNNRRAMPDPHPGQKFAYTRQFRNCNLISGRSGKDTETCRTTSVPGYPPVNGQEPKTCPFCSRLRRFCTYTIGVELWANIEGEEKKHWKGLTVFESEGVHWKRPLLIGKFKGVEQVVYDATAFDADDEVEEDAGQEWSAHGRQKSNKKVDDGEGEVDFNDDIKFLDA